MWKSLKRMAGVTFFALPTFVVMYALIAMLCDLVSDRFFGSKPVPWYLYLVLVIVLGTCSTIRSR